MSKLILKLVILALFVSLISMGIDRAYHAKTNLPPNRPPANLLPLPSISEQYQIAKVGNSHAQDGITFKGYRLKSLDLSGVAQRFSFDLVMLKQYRNQIAPGAIIVINASPISFSHRPADRNDGLQGNYYGRVSPFLIPDLKVGDYVQSQLVPFLRSPYLWRKNYADAVAERIAKEQKWVEPTPSPSPVPQPTIRPRKRQVLNIPAEDLFFSLQVINAEYASPSAIKNTRYLDNMNFIFNKWYHTDEFNPKYFDANRRDLEKLIEYCLQNKWRPVVITIPVTKILQDGLLDDYYDTYLYKNLKKTDLKGAEYLDYTHLTQITTNLSFFDNADHMSEKGRAFFSYILLQDLIKKGYLEKDADGYYYGPLHHEEDW